MIAKSLIVNGSGRFLNTLYADNLTVAGTTSFASLAVSGNATVSGTLHAAGATSTNGILNIGNTTQANAILQLNNKKALAGTDSWLRINDTKAFTYGVYFGGSLIRTDGSLQIGNNGSALNFTTSSGTVSVPTTFSGKVSTDNIVATNLQVTDTLRSFKWDIDHVANLGGTFLVTPTYIASSTATFTPTSINTSTGVIQATINDGSITGDTMGGVTWANQSKIKITGKVNNVTIPTCDGKLTNILASGVMRVEFTCPTDIVNSFTANTIYKASEGKLSDLTVMLTTVGATNPVGIYMTARDSNNYSHISLYGGTSVNPTVRIGNLQGLPAVNGVSPDDLDDKWGIYTSNGFFSGTIVSSSGKIGNFNLTDKLYTGSHNTWNHASNGIYIASDGIAGGNGGTWYLWNDGTGKIGKYTFASNGALTTGSGSTQAGMGGTYAFWAGSSTQASAPFRVTYDGAFTSTSGTIGGWTIGTSDLHNGTNSMTSTTAGLYLGTGGIRNYASATAYTNIQNGVITAVGANISGSIAATSGTIGSNSTAGNRWQIGDKAIYNTTNSMTSTGVGTYVGVDGIRNYKDANTFVNIQNGKITAKAVDLTGTINATAGTFGNGTNKITVGNGGTANSAIYYGMNTLNSSTASGFYVGTDGIALGGGVFNVHANGESYIGGSDSYIRWYDSDDDGTPDSLEIIGDTIILGNDQVATSSDLQITSDAIYTSMSETYSTKVEVTELGETVDLKANASDVAEIETRTTNVEQTVSNITSTIESFITSDDMETYVSSQVQQNADSLSISFIESITQAKNEVTESVASTYLTTANAAESYAQKDKTEQDIQTVSDLASQANNNINEEIEARQTYFNYGADGLTIGKSTSDLKLELTNARMSFMDGTEEVAYASGGEFHAPNMSVESALTMGDWQWIPRANGNLALKYIGE